MYDPGILPDAPTITEQREFTDRAGNNFTLAMRVDSGGDTWWSIQALKDTLLAKWSDPARLVKFSVSEPSCLTIATLMTYSVEPTGLTEPWAPWPFEYWANLLRRDINTFSDVLMWVRELEAKAQEQEAGNG